MRHRRWHVLSGIALACAIFAVVLLGALHLGGTSAADGLRAAAPASAGHAPHIPLTAAPGTRSEHLATAPRAVQAQPAWRQLRFARAVLAAVALFLVRPRRGSRLGGVENSVAGWCSSLRSGRGPPAVRIA